MQFKNPCSITKRDSTDFEHEPTKYPASPQTISTFKDTTSLLQLKKKRRNMK
jgi:hypothetical protein